MLEVRFVVPLYLGGGRDGICECRRCGQFTYVWECGTYIKGASVNDIKMIMARRNTADKEYEVKMRIPDTA